MRETFETFIFFSKLDAAVPLNTLPGMPQYITLPPQMPGPGPAEEGRYVHQWFQVHAECSPDQIALSSAESGRTLSYGDLHMSSAIRAQCQCLPFTRTANAHSPSLAI